MVSRRKVLRFGAQASAVAGAGVLYGATANSAYASSAHAHSAYANGARRTAPQVPESAWRDLERELSPGAGPFRPWDAEYRKLVLPDNRRYASVQPAGIVACNTEKDVSVALRWAVRHGLPFAPRSGGHNYAGFSTTTGLLITLQRMNGVTPGVNTPTRKRLIVDGGATNSDVAAARATHLYFPGGRCPGVGVAGLTLGGGLGFNDRRWGMTCDRLVETRIVLADGTVARATEHENADLFWACRGGAGGNFGINTGFVFDAVDVSAQNAAVFDLTFPVRRGVEVMNAVQQVLAADRDDAFDIRVGFKNDGDGTPPVVWLLGQRLGDEDGLRRALAPVLHLGPPKVFIEERHFWDAQDRLMDRPGAPAAMASKSLVPHAWLDTRAVEHIVEWIENWHPGGTDRKGAVGYVTLFAMGGASDHPLPHETAYPHRGATFVVDIGSSWAPGTPPEEVGLLLARLRTMHGTLSGDIGTTAAYVNFPDPDLADWRHSYYQGNYERLVAVKRRYDEDGVFRYGQGVGG